MGERIMGSGNGTLWDIHGDVAKGIAFSPSNNTIFPSKALLDAHGTACASPASGSFYTHRGSRWMRGDETGLIPGTHPTHPIVTAAQAVVVTLVAMLLRLRQHAAVIQAVSMF